MAHPNQFTAKWGEEATSLLRDLWENGLLSAEGIADELYVKLRYLTSRNAVIGKAHRMRLAKKRPENPPVPGKPKKKRVRVRPPHNPDRSRWGKDGGLAMKVIRRIQDPAKIRPVRIETGPPEALMITLLQLTEHTCKYTLGEATGAAQLFCGAPKDVTDSWCPYHHRIVFLPARGFMEKRFGDLAEKVAA